MSKFEIGMYASRTPIGVWVMSDADAAELSLLLGAHVRTNDSFELWWAETFGESRNTAQDQVKSVAFTAWNAGQSKAEATQTKEVMLHAVTKFELFEERKVNLRQQIRGPLKPRTLRTCIVGGLNRLWLRVRRVI
jgi:hypothetical protein